MNKNLKSDKIINNIGFYMDRCRDEGEFATPLYYSSTVVDIVRKALNEYHEHLEQMVSLDVSKVWIDDYLKFKEDGNR